MRSFSKTPISLLVAVLISGCNIAGPESLRSGRMSYNMAIQQTSCSQMLLNLVRLRYRDTPFFLQVASVSSNLTISASTGGSASLPESVSNSYGVTAGVGVSESPTVTYTPLQGDKFVKQLMTPVDPNIILLLTHSGWSIDRIMRVTIQQINDLKNAPTASGPTPAETPEYRDFRDASKLLRSLQKSGALKLGTSAGDKKDVFAIEMSVTDEGRSSRDFRRLCELLNLDATLEKYAITTEVGEGDRNRITIVPRSLIASLFYCSQGVGVSERDEEEGKVTITRNDDGRRFDWSLMLGDLISIRSSKLPPANAYAAVYYRDAWFYIDDSDLNSKSTFSLLMQLFALQAGNYESSGPILTLPVSR